MPAPTSSTTSQHLTGRILRRAAVGILVAALAVLGTLILIAPDPSGPIGHSTATVEPLPVMVR